MDNLYKKYYLKLTPYVDIATAQNLAQELALDGVGNIIIRRVDESHIAIQTGRGSSIVVISMGGKRLSYIDYVKQTNRDPFKLYESKNGTVDTNNSKDGISRGSLDNNTTYVIRNT